MRGHQNHWLFDSYSIKILSFPSIPVFICAWPGQREVKAISEEPFLEFQNLLQLSTTSKTWCLNPLNMKYPNQTNLSPILGTLMQCLLPCTVWIFDHHSESRIGVIQIMRILPVINVQTKFPQLNFWTDARQPGPLETIGKTRKYKLRYVNNFIGKKNKIEPYWHTQFILISFWI